ncbi:hypothetical protein BDW69DRAFT_165794 [Aspergillus filifer]
MPPTFRSSRSGRQFNDGPNRTRTGQIDHDVFEGLPVRRWSRQVQTVSQEPRVEGTESDAPGHAGKPSIPEHPMPKDSHLLSPMSRALLRAARSGCVYIRKASKEYDDEEKDTTDADEQQTQQKLERNFSMRKWTSVPKHLEAPEVEFLAKRRPGLPSLYGASAGAVEGANVPMRKTRFKKVDPVTGNISIYAAWVPEGHKIEGEIADDAQVATENTQVTVTPQAPAPGTVIEGVGVVNAQGVVVAEAGSASVLTPPKRRPPPPKRKGKGLKGRRKKVMFAPGEGADASLVHGPGAVGDGAGKDMDPSRMSVDQTTQDDEDDDGEEGEESDDGEGDESGFEAKTPETPGAQPESEPTPGSAIEPTPTPAPIKSETPQLPQAPLQELKSEPEPVAEPRPVFTHSVAPSVPEVTPAASVDATGSDAPESSRVTAPAAPVAEDVQMADAIPTTGALRSTSIAASETQLRATRESVQPVSTAKASSPREETQQPSGPEPSNVAAMDAQTTTNRRQEEPMDVTMGESNDSIPEPPRADPKDMDVSTETPLPEQPQNKEPTPQQLNQQSESNQFDLLDSLEASLGGAPNATRSNEQERSTQEQKQELSAQGAASEHESATPFTKTPEAPTPAEPFPNEKPAREDPVAPPVEQLTPPEAEQTATPDVTTGTSAEQQQAEQTPEGPTEPASLPAAKSVQTQPTTQQSASTPSEPVPAKVLSQPGSRIEPPIAKELSPHQSSSEDGTEQQAEATAEAVTRSPSGPTFEATAESNVTVEAAPVPTPAPVSVPKTASNFTPEQSQPAAASQDTPKEPSPSGAEPAAPAPTEPAAEQQGEKAQTGAAQGEGASDDGPSSNGE